MLLTLPEMVGMTGPCWLQLCYFVFSRTLCCPCSVEGMPSRKEDDAGVRMPTHIRLFRNAPEQLCLITMDHKV